MTSQITYPWITEGFATAINGLPERFKLNATGFFRDPNLNKSEGGDENSRHLHGDGGDFQYNQNAKDLYAWLTGTTEGKAYKEKHNIGVDTHGGDHLHLEIG